MLLQMPLTDINVPGDGNCLFHALSLAITGSIEQQGKIHAAIINHMNTIESHLVGHWIPSPPYLSVKNILKIREWIVMVFGGQILRQLQWPTCLTRQYTLMMYRKEHGFVTNLLMVLRSIPLVL